MGDRPSGTAAGLLLALSLGLVAILGLMCVGAGIFLFRASGTSAVAGGGTPAGSIWRFNAEVSRVDRLPDGSYNILVVGTLTGFGEIGKVRVDDVRLIDVPSGDCTIMLPPGPPYPQTLNFVVHTRPLPPELQTAQLRFVVSISGTAVRFENVFGITKSTTMEVELQPAEVDEPSEPATLKD